MRVRNRNSLPVAATWVMVSNRQPHSVTASVRAFWILSTRKSAIRHDTHANEHGNAAVFDDSRFQDTRFTSMCMRANSGGRFCGLPISQSETSACGITRAVSVISWSCKIQARTHRMTHVRREDAIMMPTADQLAHTYSIVARDPDTGQLGVAVQSHYFPSARSSRGRKRASARSRRRRSEIPLTESSGST